MLIHTYYKRNKTVFLVLRFSPEGGQVAIPWRKQMLKFNFMDGMFNIHLHNHFMKKKKKSSHMFILSFKKGFHNLLSVCLQKRQGSISNSSARRKNIRVDCCEIKTLYLIFSGEENYVYGCHYCPLSQQGK